MKKRYFKVGIFLTVTLIWSGLAWAAEYSLSELYAQALKNSEKIKMAEENIYIAQMGQYKALSLLIPRLTATAGYSRYTEQKYSAAGVLIQPNEGGTWTVRADQTFTLNARELDALKVAGQTIKKTEYDLETAKSDYLLAVASSYYDVLKAKKALEIATANMARLSQYRNSVETRVKVGEQTKTALLRAEGELSGARAEYVKATNALLLSRAALMRATGVEDDFRLKEEKNPLSGEHELRELRKTALESRADLKSYDMQTQMAARQVKYAQGAFWPNVGLFAVYNGADQNPVTASLNRESVYGGVSLSFPFFEGGLRMAELKEARAKERQARLMYEDAKKSVDVELQGAYLELETLKGSLVYLSDQLTFAQDNYDSVLRQYENGLATSLDVMDANNLLLTSEKNYADTLYGYQLAQLKVRKSSGTLLRVVETQK